jgi:hypothetical protein
MTSTTTRKYNVNDMVCILDGGFYGTIVGTVERDHYLAEGVQGWGPLYLVNEGNVFMDCYEAVYAESDLGPWDKEAQALYQWNQRKSWTDAAEAFPGNPWGEPPF